MAAPYRRASIGAVPNPGRAGWVAALFALLTATAGAQSSVDPLPEELLAAARSALQEGAHDSAAANLRQLRLLYPESPLVADSLMLAARVAAEQGNPFRERFLLTEARRSVRALAASGKLADGDAAGLRLPIAQRLGALLEQERDYDGALRNYTEAIALLAARARTAASLHERRELAHARLAAARLNHRYGVGASGDAERLFDQIDPDHLTGEAFATYGELARSLMWSYLTPRDLGMNDANISAIATDGDDVWVGSWTGGLARYTRSTGQRAVFRAGPRSLQSLRVRDIATVDDYIWVGTDRGLSVYALASSRWRHELTIGDEREPVSLAAIATARDTVFAGTLGQGLWRDDGSGWQAVAGALPGLFITALQVVGDTLWIGTIDLGVVALDLASGAVRSFDEINPDLGPQNVTAIVPGAGADEALWITTFGSGVYRWLPGPNRITHFSAAGGELPDDWVLSGAAGENGMYFGTFGGGVARYAPPSGAWSVISLAHGLPSLNVAVVTAARGKVYFGTLGGGVAVLSERRSVYGL